MDELVIKAQHFCSVQEDNNFHWKQQPLQQNIMVPTSTILCPRFYVVEITGVYDIPKHFVTRCEQIVHKKKSYLKYRF